MQSVYIELLGPRSVGLLDKKYGGFAEVLILSTDGGGPSHAFKLLKQDIGPTDSVITEINVLSRLPPHPHVVEVEGYSKSDFGSGILFAYFPSNLRSVMRSSSSLKEKIFWLNRYFAA
jgi:hypothetical protein